MARRWQRGLQVPEHLQDILAGQRLVTVQQVHRLVFESFHRAFRNADGCDNTPVMDRTKLSDRLAVNFRTKRTVFHDQHTTFDRHVMYMKTNVQHSYTVHCTLRAQPVCIATFARSEPPPPPPTSPLASFPFSSRAPFSILLCVRPRARCDDNNVLRGFKMYIKIVEINGKNTHHDITMIV